MTQRTHLMTYCSPTALMAVATVTCGLHGTATAAEWTLDPYIGSSVQYTDNVFGTSNDQESDLITSLDLGVKITAETRRTDFDLSYDVSQDFYADFDALNGYRHNFVSGGEIELFEEHLYIDGRLTFTEETLDDVGRTSAGDRTLGTDRTQVLSGRISPYFVQNFGGWVTSVARYGYSETRFLESDVGSGSTQPANQRTNEFELQANSGTRFANLQWQVLSNYTFSESSEEEEFHHLNNQASAEIPLSRLFSLLVTAGHDDFDIDDVDDDAISGPYAGGGIRFHPNSRTDARFQVGYRFDDIIYDLQLEYAPTSMDSVTASYSVNVRNADTSLANTDILNADDELIRPNFSTASYIDDVTKSETFTLAWSGERRRNSYGANINLINREVLSDGVKDRVLSVGANFSRRLTPRADLTISGNYSGVLAGETAAEETNTYSLGVDYNYQLGRGLTASAGYDYLLQDEKIGGNVEENAFTISLRKTF